jgi:hypothetical protein
MDSAIELPKSELERVRTAARLNGAGREDPKGADGFTGGSRMLTEQNIEVELSYAYLHAVASKFGFACEYTSRHMEWVAVDAIVREEGRLLAADSVLGAFEAHFQLKATYQPLKAIDERWSFSLPIHQYNRLRETRVQSPRVVVVLQLPPDPEEWLRHPEEALVVRQCA